MRKRKFTKEERRSNLDNKSKELKDTPSKPITEKDLDKLLEHFGQKKEPTKIR